MQPASPNDFDPNHARVLVVGPMASGKTALVQSLCHGGIGGTATVGVRSRPHPPTIGCNVDVKVLPITDAVSTVEVTGLMLVSLGDGGREA